MMNIVVASDENYSIHMLTLLISIGENNNKVNAINVYIFDGGINNSTQTKIQNLSKKYSNMNFVFIEMTEEKIYSMLGESIKKDRSLLTFARIFIPQFVDGDRALYLDVDAIVLGNLKSLYDLDLMGKAIAGVCDTNPLQRHLNVGLNKNDIYINAGMILFNLKKCREIDFTGMCLNFIKSKNGSIDAMDQGTINGVLGSKDMIQAVSPKYNVLTTLFQMNSNKIKIFYNLNNYYTDDEIDNAKRNPVFVHFTPNFTTRPWIKNCKHPLKDEYWKYREMYNSKKVLDEDKRSFKLKTIGFLFYHIPFSIFNFLVKVKL